ncbi:putative ATP-dependent endonuclease of OLD family [Rhodobacter aestuarii]|uniref:Putative ATP-dependent endonuclease of the OLD family n=1 Tax=Rhodobacter aestuarii TaxID=453582 RepID=A0A1N7QC30_9RHOB|nr:AAA family ATPase [Rhodobacter aestuarii]PTV93699.1 putative ATP-dependent endonuclease of OLD family [Rhodobacter aestuarii]SIT20433.1 putative ATP-dependent endonuclease of the OLD family [Rhodobacter aestuarii]
MRVCRISINHFRGIKGAVLHLPKHAVLIGDNNTGKTTILEALDLALGPDRLNRTPPIDEHDFHQGQYLAELAPDAAEGDDGDAVAAALGPNEPAPAEDHDAKAPRIEIEVTIADLSEEQLARFGDSVEFWDSKADTFYDAPNPEGIDPAHIVEALRVTFHGWYDAEEDDFEGRTYFTRSLLDGGTQVLFTKKDKQACGFLYLRSLRTGTRALSLERGSLLDIILRLKEVRPQMWEDTLATLSGFSVAADPDLGITGVLESINTALKKYVPKEWGIEPHLKVSNLTRDHLRKVITAFIATGEGQHAAPYYRQGTGTINMLVLAMLSQIAADKQNVIFAMEEPETAIPPYAQKRIVHEIRQLASQALFTSHSPYVLEEFAIEETVVLGRDSEGVLSRKPISLPDNVKLKRYRQQFRVRFCEGLLARRILVAEGATEASAFPVVCRRLSELKPDTYRSLEAMGVCVVDADSETNIPGMARLYRDLGKRTFALCDKQEAAHQAAIEQEVECLLMHGEKGFEAMVLKGTTEDALKRFAATIDWPQDLTQTFPDPVAQATDALAAYFKKNKGNWGISDFLAQCSEDEIPEWLRQACTRLKDICDPPPPAEAAAQTEAGEPGAPADGTD